MAFDKEHFTRLVLDSESKLQARKTVEEILDMRDRFLSGTETPKEAEGMIDGLIATMDLEDITKGHALEAMSLLDELLKSQQISEDTRVHIVGIISTPE